MQGFWKKALPTITGVGEGSFFAGLRRRVGLDEKSPWLARDVRWLAQVIRSTGGISGLHLRVDYGEVARVRRGTG